MRLLPLVLASSLALNLWGNGWGTPKSWHADEITERTIHMVHSRDPRPPYYMYGVLPYYVVAMAAVVPVSIYARIADRAPPRGEEAIWNTWADRQQTRTVRLARSLSAIVSTLTVGLTFVVGSLMFGGAVGILAAAMLTVAPTFVLVAHVATVDSYANLFFWLTCAAAALAWRRADSRWLLVAGLAAGIAVGIKTDRVVVLFPVLAAYLLSGSRRPGWRVVGASAALLPVGFALANPPLLFDTFAFLDGYSRELAFNALRPREGGEGFLQVPRLLLFALGIPLFTTSMAALALAVVRIGAGRDRKRLVWLVSALLPYYLLFSSRLIEWSYVIVLLPAFTILAAYGCVAAYRAIARPFHPVAGAAVGIIVVITFAHLLALMTHLTTSTRAEASEWIERYVEPGTHLAMHGLGPVLSRTGEYRLTLLVPDRQEGGVTAYTQGGHRQRLESHRPYRWLRDSILAAEKWAGRAFGTRVRELPYIAWFDWVTSDYEGLGAREGAPGEAADYLVLLDFYHPRTLAVLRQPASGFELAARFEKPRTFVGLTPDLEFLNPTVSIYRRTREVGWPATLVLR